MVKPLGWSLIAIVFGAVLASGEQAQVRLRYDPGSEATVRGTIVEVREVASGEIPRGTYLVLRTLTNKLYVHLGPRGRLARPAAQLSSGDSVEVAGSLVRRNGSTILLAREVRKGETRLTLRNAHGFPAAGRHRAP